MIALATVVSILLAVDARASVPSLIMQAGTVAKIVLILLFLMSVVSWGILWERGRLVRRVSRADDAFLQAFRAGRGLAESRMAAAQYPQSILGKLSAVGLEHLGVQGRGPLQLDPASVDLATRAMQRSRVVELEQLEKHLTFLATTGSVAPFLGLLGTVWGVMTAFLNIGVQGSASLIVVAPGIAEALIATIAGLAAAIPAVVGYNHFVGRVRSIDNRALAFISEFSDTALHEARLEDERGRAAGEPLRREVGV